MLWSNILTGIDIKSPLPDTSISLARLPPGGVPDRVGGASCPPKIQLRQDPKNTPLDSLTISGTISRQKEISSAFKKAVKTRFSGNHWHTVQFREWAEQAENTVICHTCVEARRTKRTARYRYLRASNYLRICQICRGEKSGSRLQLRRSYQRALRHIRRFSSLVRDSDRSSRHPGRLRGHGADCGGTPGGVVRCPEIFASLGLSVSPRH